MDLYSCHKHDLTYSDIEPCPACERDRLKDALQAAIQRAERMEHNWHWVFETLGIPKEADGSLDLDKAQPVLSALAAARKEVEGMAKALIQARDEIIKGDPESAYHAIYTYADSIAIDPYKPWVELEARAALAPKEAQG